MRRPQNLKKQQLPSVWTKQLFLHSRRVGDFFKYLWPFYKSWTLITFGKKCIESADELDHIYYMGRL